jgi:hypothetical protein
MVPYMPPDAAAALAFEAAYIRLKTTIDVPPSREVFAEECRRADVPPVDVARRLIANAA